MAPQLRQNASASSVRALLAEAVGTLVSFGAFFDTVAKRVRSQRVRVRRSGIHKMDSPRRPPPLPSSKSGAGSTKWSLRPRLVSPPPFFQVWVGGKDFRMGRLGAKMTGKQIPHKLKLRNRTTVYNISRLDIDNTELRFPSIGSIHKQTGHCQYRIALSILWNSILEISACMDSS